MLLEPFQMLLMFMIILSFYMSFQDEASNYPEPIADQIVYDALATSFFVISVGGIILNIVSVIVH